MELQLASILQYKLLKFVGKELALPMFMDNLTTISTLLQMFKSTQVKTSTPSLKNELEKADLAHKIVTISEFIKRMSDDKYRAEEIHIHLCGIYEVLDNIKLELQKVSEESEYMKTWSYVFTSLYYSSQVSIENIKKMIQLLDSRYDMLLKILMAMK
jgi:hypothetical protein